MSSVVGKIENLRDSVKTNTIGEVSSLAAIAHQIIFKHRLADEETSTPIEDSEFVYSTARVTRWKSRLVHLLASNYGCVIWNDVAHGASKSGRNISRFRLIGNKSDIETTHYMFSWLVKAIEDICKEQFKGKGHIASQSYCEGAVTGIKLQFENINQKNNLDFLIKKDSLKKLSHRFFDAEEMMYFIHKNLKTTKNYPHIKLDNNSYRLGVYNSSAPN